MQTNLPISTTQAKNLKLSGCDTYKFSHLIYLNEIHRDYGCLTLCIEALNAFSDTITITEHKRWKNEMHALINLKEQSQPIRQEIIFKKSSFKYFEFFKIATGFELYLKSILLFNNYIIHEIDDTTEDIKALASLQKKEPISKVDFFKFNEYLFNGKENYLPNLRSSSLQFSTTLKTKYSKTYNLTNKQLSIINEYRQLRNSIHFPGDLTPKPNIDSLGLDIGEYLIGFINSNIITFSNNLISKHWPQYPLRKKFV